MVVAQGRGGVERCFQAAEIEGQRSISFRLHHIRSFLAFEAGEIVVPDHVEELEIYVVFRV